MPPVNPDPGTPVITSFLRSEAFAAARRIAAERLLAARGPGGHWQGRLSSSALATATAITALRLVDTRLATTAHRSRITAGARWLVDTQRTDGSWGDTVISAGNLSTTLLCWAALAAVVDDQAAADDLQAEDVAGLTAAIARAAAWIEPRTGSLDGPAIGRALAAIYGRDKTFAVPILTHVVLCGRVGDPREPTTWRAVPQLPFELAALPQSWFRSVDLQVVSYALPALIAIGQVRHAHAPTGLVGRSLRAATAACTLRRLTAIQPVNGGFLEATPLTSFVTMSLAGIDLAAHPVATRGTAFLVASQRDDGAWPIDTNLATWCTTLSVAALAAGDRLGDWLDRDGRDAIRGWLLDQQWRRTHPYTGAAAGGWAWTDLPGGVPDADDTSGAIAALCHLAAAEGKPADPETHAAAAAGLAWLTDLANRDGGLPTFCRGWGRLPFDTSCPDITAHFLRAAAAWSLAAMPDAPRRTRAVAAAHRYLAATQATDGSWSPLWFGNEQHGAQANPVYGTAKVVAATLDRRGAEWLLAAAGPDGGFGGGPGLDPSIEETAIAAEALARVALEADAADLRHRAGRAVDHAVRWLVAHTAGATRFPASPIGLYFAKLWYFEDLYPLVFTVAAFERAAALDRASRSADT
jgi:squalene-hopene/tetraprenyl-beta-curcumene cyclase